MKLSFIVKYNFLPCSFDNTAHKMSMDSNVVTYQDTPHASWEGFYGTSRPFHKMVLIDVT